MMRAAIKMDTGGLLLLSHYRHVPAANETNVSDQFVSFRRSEGGCYFTPCQPTPSSFQPMDSSVWNSPQSSV